VQYDDLVKGTSFVQDPGRLTPFDPVGVRIGLTLGHRGVEALEQSLAEARTDRDAARADVEDRSKDVDRLQEELRLLAAAHLTTRQTLALQAGELACRSDELAASRSEIAGLQSSLAQRRVEVANLEAAVADFMKQLDAFRHSLSWRWTAPLRAIYRLLSGR
jgi:chromosome segregation ATPase